MSIDRIGSILKSLLLAGFVLSIFIGRYFDLLRKSDLINNFVLLLFSSFISVSSNSLLFTFVAFEILSLSYFSFLRLRSGTDLIAYYRSWLISSSLMLFGISVLYGLLGSLKYPLMSDYMSKNPVNSLTLTISALLVFIGFGAKMYVFPFQSLMSKTFSYLSLSEISVIMISTLVAGSGALVKFVTTAFADTSAFNTNYNVYVVFNWELCLTIIFCISVLSSAFILYLQKNFFKAVLYLLLINAQYLLISGFEKNGFGLITYLMYLVFIISSASGILCLVNYFITQYSVIEIKDLKGLFKESRIQVIALALMLLSITGLPLTMGFSSRIFIFSAVSKDYIVYVIAASVIAVFISAISIYRILTAVIVTQDKLRQKIRMRPMELTLVLSVLAVMFLFGIFPQLIVYFLEFIVIN